MKYFMLMVLLQRKYLAIIALVVLATLAINSYYKLAYQQTVKGNFSAIKAPLIVFDFDGTICPSYPLFIDLIKEWSEKKVIKEVTEEEVDEFKNLSPKEIMKACGISSFKLPFLLKNARDRVQKEILELEPELILLVF